MTISVRVEGSPHHGIDISVPVSTEQELININYHLDGYYMLMNDIVMQNKVEGIMPNTVNEPLTQEYKDVNGNPVWTYNKAVITQRTTLTSGEGKLERDVYGRIRRKRIHGFQFENLFPSQRRIVRQQRGYN